MVAQVNRMEYLLISTKGEKYAKEMLPMMTHTDVLSGGLVWEKATTEYSFNPFGKLIKKPSRILPNGTVFEHKKHFHGWFGTLKCTKSFYENHKEALDEFITDDPHFNRKWLPKTY